MSIAPALTDARAKAEQRFYRAALWHAADPACSSAYAEFEDAYEALSALSRQSLADKLGRRPTPTAAGLSDGGGR